VLQLIVLDSLFKSSLTLPGQPGLNPGETGWLKGYWDALNESVLVGVFRDTVIPIAGTLARPFVPDEIARLLHV
jgi:hypothetical protein